MYFSIRMENEPGKLPKNYTRSSDLAWKLTNGLMALFFFTSAVLQVNDPDSVIWIILYLVPGCMCFAVIIFPNIQEFWHFKSLALLQLVISIAGILYTIYHGSKEIVKHKTNIFETEEGREAGGLAIVVAWLIILLRTNSKHIQSMTLSSWIKVVSVAILPVTLTMIWLYTVDISLSPKHCKGILSKISQKN